MTGESRMIFLVSDTHFNHPSIISFAGRPFNSCEEMNNKLIDRWNQVVSQQDTVIHLGDFGFGRRQNEEIREQLNGVVILLKGSHDSANYRGIINVRRRIIYEDLVMTHCPLYEQTPEGFRNVHGHLHQKFNPLGINICVEHTNYYPIPLDDVLSGKFR